MSTRYFPVWQSWLNNDKVIVITSTATVRISGFSHEGYLITLAGFSLRGEGHRTLSVVKMSGRVQVVSLDLSQRICLSSWRFLAHSLYPKECGGGGAVTASVPERRCRSVTLESMVGLSGGEWSLDGSVEEGGVLAWGDRNTVEFDMQKSEKGRQHERGKTKTTKQGKNLKELRQRMIYRRYIKSYIVHRWIH